MVRAPRQIRCELPVSQSLQVCSITAGRRARGGELARALSVVMLGSGRRREMPAPHSTLFRQISRTAVCLTAVSSASVSMNSWPLRKVAFARQRQVLGPAAG